MKRTTIELEVVKDVCLGYEVFRGSAPANEIVGAAWIDFHDPHQNPLGYQRAFDERRSIRARDYAETSDQAFWPEAVLAIRNDEELEDHEIVTWSFSPFSETNEKYGILSVTYSKGLTADINEETVPWRRAFSQVDCQHRLGSMVNSQKIVTFCIIPDVSRHEEAKVFRAINQNQRAIPTSLVDTIILRTEPSAPIHFKWAWDLSVDPGSPFCNLVDTGGRGQKNTLIRFRGLQQSLKLLVPDRHIESRAIEVDDGYSFARNYWNVVRREWPMEFQDKGKYKMMVNPGVRALSRLGRKVFEAQIDVQDFRTAPISNYFKKGKKNVDWSADIGPLRNATGKGAEKVVFDKLKEWFGEPS